MLSFSSVWNRLLQQDMGPLMAIIFVYLLWRYGTSRLSSSTKIRPSPKKEKDTKYGTWKPVHFNYPTITPLSTDPLKMKPIPYRPFRAGEYPVTMGIRSMNWDEWIEIDEEFVAYQRTRRHRIQTRGKGVIRVLPDNPGLVLSGAGPSIELVHELAEYLSRRFPTTFEIVRHSSVISETTGWYGLPPIKSVRIPPLGESYDLPLHPDDDENAAVRALEIASLMIQEDIVIMMEGKDGRYYFQAGATLIAGFWRMQDKIGMPLDEIHNSGGVPRYKEKLQMNMERLFQKLAVDKPVARNNYFFQVVKPPLDDVEDPDPEELAWSETLLGPEDGFSKTHPTQVTRPTPTPSLIRLRTERQTLRRLPHTGAIAFTIRTYLTPVEQLKNEPGVVRRLAGALRGWGKDINEYKGKDAGGGWWDVLMEYLDKCSDEQIQEGQAEEMEHKYPY